MASAINMVMVDCRTELKREYNDWYDKVHIPMCMKYAGMRRVTRYRLLTGPPGHARYLTVYEFQDQSAMDAFPKSPECIAATREMKQTWKDGDFTIRLAAQYETLRVFER